MTSYETEHNIKDSPKESAGRRPRPDLSTFFATLAEVDTSGVQNPNAMPTPVMASALFRNGLEAMEALTATNENRELTERLLSELQGLVDQPPERVQGVSDEFISDLDRVPKKSLKKDDECPICGIPFLEDEYPLVVRLPCNKAHIYDLQCIEPWLKMNPTCPMDRRNFVEEKKAKQAKQQAAAAAAPKEEEEDFDDMYA